MSNNETPVNKLSGLLHSHAADLQPADSLAVADRLTAEADVSDYQRRQLAQLVEGARSGELDFADARGYRDRIVSGGGES